MLFQGLIGAAAPDATTFAASVEDVLIGCGGLLIAAISIFAHAMLNPLPKWRLLLRLMGQPTKGGNRGSSLPIAA